MRAWAGLGSDIGDLGWEGAAAAASALGKEASNFCRVVINLMIIAWCLSSSVWSN